MNFVTGEKIQQLCDIYLGFNYDFEFNPVINNQKNKHYNFEYLIHEFDNPYYIFCYSHRINDLSDKIHLFKNKFELITHNSDGEIRQNAETLNILQNSNLEKWYGQNICFKHEKLYFIPIGIANSQWSHGNLSNFENLVINNKPNNIYFNFNINTNHNKREPCYNILQNKLQWLETVSPRDNIIRLSSYKFCICPEGNGVDSHRLWEALYLKTIPIVIRSEFTEVLEQNEIPLIILNNWNEFDENKLVYDISFFENEKFKKLLNFSYSYLLK